MDPVAQLRQAQSLLNTGRAGEAVALIRPLLRTHPAWPPAWHLLALALHAGGHAAEALDAARRGTALAPDDRSILNTLAALLVQAGATGEARAAFERVLAARPGDTQALFNLSNLEWQSGQSWRAIELLRRVLALAPADRDAAYQLATSLCAIGRVAEAIDVCDRALAAHAGDTRLLGARAFALLGSSGVSPAQLADAHRALGAAHEGACAADPPRAGRSAPRGAGAPLRLGFVSPDLREHPVARFLLPLVERLDRSRFAPVAYACSAHADAVTAALRAAFERGGHGAWREISGLSDADAASAVRADGVDVLVDLAGNTIGARPGLFALRAAPVQVSYLGYPATSGMASIGHRIVDALTDPHAPAYDGQCSERLVRLRAPFLCYRPAADPPVAPRTVGATQPVRFGCFGSLHKHSDACLNAWARILAAVPGATLTLKSVRLADADVRADVAKRLSAAGIAPERTALLPPTPGVAEHLAAYNGVDIALDTFPYHGTTTTCDALHMGVPVVSLAGASHHARVGVSLLSAVGLSEFVAADGDGYVRLAASLAADAPRRGILRATLRQRLAQSPLRDEAGFAARWGEVVAEINGV